MVPEKPLRLVILGGGTAGWITAAAIESMHNGPALKAVDITVVEAAGGRIGVGEGTFPTIRALLKSFGIDEKELLRRTDAGFKLGIRFDGWNGRPEEYYDHPFGAPRLHRGMPLARAWAERFDRGEPIGSFADSCSFQTALMDHHKAPKRLGHGSYESPTNYAYHLDADKLGDYLVELCVARGVKRVVDQVAGVDVDERGWITALETREQGRIEGDFFVDCSGFRGLLINETLGARFKSFADQLLCDRAVAMRVPYAPDQPIEPYTRSTAMGAGWRWSIGLQSRRGTGYVFSSAFTSDDEAERDLRASLGPVAEDQTARFLPMRVGYNPEAWTGNCVAVGLAAGFLEPLEATGIYLIEVGARILAEHLPLDGRATPALAASYNRILAGTFHEIADFITLHYALSTREDTPFWRAVGHRRVLSDALRARLELWDERPPRDFDLAAPLGTYQAYSWECVLFGMGWRPRRWGGLHGSAAGSEDVERTFAEVRTARQRSVADLADHAHFLKNYR